MISSTPTGFNKFYLSDHHRELGKHFGAGPNVFDRFTLSGTQSAPFSVHLNEQIGMHVGREAELAARLADTNQQIARLFQDIATLTEQLNTLREAQRSPKSPETEM